VERTPLRQWVLKVSPLNAHEQDWRLDRSSLCSSTITDTHTHTHTRPICDANPTGRKWPCVCNGGRGIRSPRVRANLPRWSSKSIKKFILINCFVRPTQITQYAEELERDLATLQWPEGTMTAQRAWIGKSQGARIVFPLPGQDQDGIEVRASGIACIAWGRGEASVWYEWWRSDFLRRVRRHPLHDVASWSVSP
jgi:hypothetical protein